MRAFETLLRLLGKGVRSSERPRQPNVMPAPSDTGGGVTLGAASLRGVVDAPSPWSVGQLIAGTYEVTGILGEGAFGTVYRVRHKYWNKDLAVKRPKADAFRTAMQQASLAQEAETWINLGLHPHLVSCYYVRTLDGAPTLFAECVDGGSLADSIATRRMYEGDSQSILTRILDIAIQMAWGLQHIHDQGLVHRDVKPGNVLLTHDGVAKVTDFGLVQAQSKSFTLRYASPEQQAGLPPTPEADMWSWAVTILELFLGKAKWQTGAEASNVLAEYQHTPRDDRSIPQMPRRLCESLAQCFDASPHARPRGVESLIDVLTVCYQEQTGAQYPRRLPEAVALRSGSLNNRALSLLDVGREEEALASWSNALQIDPHHLESTFNYGIQRWRQGQIDDIALVKQLEEVGAANEQSWACGRLLSVVHRQRGDPAAAESILAANQPPFTSPAIAPFVDGGPSASTEGWTVASIALSSDGRWAVSGDHRGTISLWDTNERRRRVVLEAYDADEQRPIIGSVAVSPDGRKAASGTWASDVSLWDLDEGIRTHRLEGHASPVDCVAFSPDGRVVLSGARSDDEMRLWDAQSGMCIGTYPGHGNHLSIKSVCFSPDGRLALSGGAQGILRLWQLETATCVWSVELGADITATAFSADGRFAACAAKDVQVWDLGLGRCINTFSSSECVAVALSQDRKWCVAGYKSGELRVWEVETRRCARTVEMADSVQRGDELHPSGDGDTNDDDVLSRELGLLELQTLGIDSLTVSSSANSAVFTYAAGHGVHFYTFGSLAPFGLEFQISSPVETAAMQAIHDRARRGLARARRSFDAGQQREAYSRLREVQQLPGYERSEELWAFLGACSAGRRTALQQAWLRWSIQADGGGIHCLALSADGRLAFTGDTDKLVKMWHVSQQKQLKSLEGHERWVTGVAVPSHSRWVVSGSHDHTIRVWQLEEERHAVLQGHRHWVTCVAISPDDRFILSGSRDGTARLWDCATGKCLRILGRPDSEGEPDRMILSVAFTPEGRRVVVGRGDGIVELWSLDDGQLVRVFSGHQDAVRAVVSHDGNRIVSASLDSTVRVWAIGGEGSSVWHGHTDGVVCVAAFKDNRWALSGSRDGTMRLWESATSHRTLEGHDGTVAAVVIEPEGRWCLSAGQDGTLRRWEFDWLLDFPADTLARKEVALQFPEVADWRRTAKSEFADPRHGFMVGYNSSKSEAKISVYVYNQGLARIEDDLASRVLLEEFGASKRGIEAGRAGGQYSELEQEVAGQRTLGGVKTARGALYVRFAAKLVDTPSSRGTGDNVVVTELYLLPYRDHFVKIRTTIPKNREESLRTSLDRLYNELNRMLASEESEL